MGIKERSVCTVPVRNVIYNEIQGINVEPKSSPLGNVAPIIKVVVLDESCIENKDRETFIQTAPNHKRSFELNLGENPYIFWADEYGNLFGSINTKGNNLTVPNVVLTEQNPSGYKFFGLQESDTILRVVKASDLLRSNGIQAEMFLAIAEPLEFPLNGKIVPLEDYKKALVKKVWDEDTQEDKSSDKDDKPLTRQQIPQLSIALDNLTFFITVRGVQTSERIQGVNPENPNYEETMRNIFVFINKEEELLANKDQNYEPKTFHFENKEDVYAYTTDYLPKKVARNFAKMHNLGLLHKYPHLANISAIGSIYDLDSVSGKALGLGDNPTSESHMAEEAAVILHDLLDAIGPIKHIEDALVSWEDFADALNKIHTNFMEAYVTERGWDHDIVANFKYIEMLLLCKVESPLSAKYAQLIARELSLEIKPSIDLHTIDRLRSRIDIEDFVKNFFDDHLFQSSLDTTQYNNQPLSRLVNLRNVVFFASVILEQIKADNNLKVLEFQKSFDPQSVDAALKTLSRDIASSLVAEFPQEFIDAYEKSDILSTFDSNKNLPRHLSNILVHISTLKGYVRERQFFTVADDVPLKKALEIFSRCEDNPTVKVFTREPEDDFKTMIGSGGSKPKVFFTDGKYEGVERLNVNLAGHEISRATYTAWIGESKGYDNTPYYIQTTLGERQVRKALKKSGIKNLKLTIEHFI